MTLINNSESGASVRSKLNDLIVSEARKLKDVATLLADTNLTYTAGQDGTVTAGGIVTTEAEGFSYEVAASGATDQHVTTAGGVKLYVLPGADGYLPLVAFNASTAAGLVSAIEAADGVGLDWGNLQINITSAVTATVAHLLWRCTGAAVTYTGAADIINPFQINIGEGVEHRIEGSGLTFDGNQKVHIGPRFTQALGSVTADFYAENLIAKNIDMTVGAGVGASGIQIRGGFNSVTLVAPEAHNLRIRTGAGTPGSSGIQGILVIQAPSVTGAYSLKTKIVRPKVRRVYSQDANYTFDMDGIGVFANPNIDVSNGISTCEIIEPDCQGCWGRDVKLQTGRASIANPVSLINEGPSTGKAFPIYDFQTGSGQVIGGSYEIDDHVCAETASVVQFLMGVALAPSANLWDGGTLKLTGAGAITRAVAHDSTFTTQKCVTRVSGVNVLGSLREFGLIGTNGNEIDTLILEGVVAETLTDALFRVESRSGGAAPYRARAIARSCHQLGADVPMLRQGVAPVSAQATISAENCTGFTRPTLVNTATTVSGGRVEDLRVPEWDGDVAWYSTGTERLISMSLANDAEYLVPAHGAGGAYAIEIRSSANDRNAYAILSCDTGGIVTVFAGSSFNIGTTTDPGSGIYRVWRDGAQLRIKNAQGSRRQFMLRLFG